MRIDRAWERAAWVAGAGCLSAAIAVAQAYQEVQAPVMAVGDKWEWSLKVNPRDTCTTSIPAGATYAEAVTALEGPAFVAAISGYSGASTRTYQPGFAYDAKVGSETIHVVPLVFPLAAGKSYESTLVSGTVVTKLTCTPESGMEKLKVGAQELDTLPITCKGQWVNRTSGNADSATYKYWYAPAAGRIARQTVYTYFQGRTCADVDVRLESFTKAK